MNTDGTQDLYMRAYAGPEHDFITVREHETDLDAGHNYSAPLKLTGGLSQASLTFRNLVGGKEAVVDCNNRASFNVVSAGVFNVDGTKYGFTNKGGCVGNQFHGEVVGSGKECDFDQDNWSDQSHEPCLGTILNLYRRGTSTPIRVRYIYDKPFFVPGSGPYVFVFPWPWLPLPRSWIGKIFNQLRRWGLFR